MDAGFDPLGAVLSASRQRSMTAKRSSAGQKIKELKAVSSHYCSCMGTEFRRGSGPNVKHPELILTLLYILMVLCYVTEALDLSASEFNVYNIFFLKKKHHESRVDSQDIYSRQKYERPNIKIVLLLVSKHAWRVVYLVYNPSPCRKNPPSMSCFCTISTTSAHQIST